MNDKRALQILLMQCNKLIKFEKLVAASPTPADSSRSEPNSNETEDAVIKQLKQLISRKDAGLDELIHQAVLLSTSLSYYRTVQ